jgi:hypothetical protein
MLLATGWSHHAGKRQTSSFFLPQLLEESFGHVLRRDRLPGLAGSPTPSGSAGSIRSRGRRET